jgi:Flp pilus assembly protein TadG
MKILALKKDRVSDESGSIAIIVTILISSTLLFGLFMAVADVSTLYTERRVVQNAADSAVLAIANECATDGFGAIDGNNLAYADKVCLNSVNAKQFAEYYANVNSPDQVTSVVEVCGTTLGACGAQPQGNLKCQSVSPQYTNFVRIVTRSREASGSSITPIFSKVLDSTSGGIDVFGCAQAAWGNSGSATVLFPFSLSICDYQQAGSITANDFASNSPTLTQGCSITDLSGTVLNYTSPLSGFALTSGFGCPGSSTPQSISVGDQLRIETSLSQLESICGSSSAFYASLSNLVGNKIIVPAVGNVVCNSQSNNCQGSFTFNVAGFLSFNFIGGKFQNRGTVGMAPTSGWPNKCNASRNCIYGNFDKGLVSSGTINTNPGVPNTGTRAVLLIQ